VARRRNFRSGYGYEWSGASYQEIKAGNAGSHRAGVRHRRRLPGARRPVRSGRCPWPCFWRCLSALWAPSPRFTSAASTATSYFQIGLLTLVGLAAKNAILIVEFCVVLRRQGKSIFEAAIEAARLRFRPILMTSLAFILGVLPLVIAKGAGAAGRHSIGTGIMGGMIAATVLAVFFVPVFFVLITRTTEWIGGSKRQATPGVGAGPATTATHSPEA
jgi:multidrug efflux pump